MDEEDALIRREVMCFAARFATLRKERGLTHQALFDKTGIHVMQVHRYESGSCLSSDQALKLTAALGKTPTTSSSTRPSAIPMGSSGLLFEAGSRFDSEEKNDAKRQI